MNIIEFAVRCMSSNDSTDPVAFFDSLEWVQRSISAVSRSSQSCQSFQASERTQWFTRINHVSSRLIFFLFSAEGPTHNGGTSSSSSFVSTAGTLAAHWTSTPGPANKFRKLDGDARPIGRRQPDWNRRWPWEDDSQSTGVHEPPQKREGPLGHQDPLYDYHQSWRMVTTFFDHLIHPRYIATWHVVSRLTPLQSWSSIQRFIFAA